MIFYIIDIPQEFWFLLLQLPKYTNCTSHMLFREFGFVLSNKIKYLIFAGAVIQLAQQRVTIPSSKLTTPQWKWIKTFQAEHSRHLFDGQLFNVVQIRFSSSTSDHQQQGAPFTYIRNLLSLYVVQILRENEGWNSEVPVIGSS